MTHPYYPFQSSPAGHPYYPYEDSDEYVGALSDVTPLGVIVPSLGIAQGFGLLPKGFGAVTRPVSTPETDWSLLAKVGLGVGVLVAGYFVYKSVRTSASMSRSAIRGAIGGQ